MKRLIFILVICAIKINFGYFYGQNFSFYLSDKDQFKGDSLPAITPLDSIHGVKNIINAFVSDFGIISPDRKFIFCSEGLWTTVPVYNFVDGLWLGQSFLMAYKPDNKYSLEIRPMVYYTTAKKTVIWSVNSDIYYARKMNGKFTINAGNLSVDYDTEEHLGRLENSLYSLGLGKNYMKLFNKRFIEIKNDFYPLRGLRVYAGVSLQWRRMEDNHTTYSFINSDFDTSNIPENNKFEPMPYNKALIWDIGTDFTLYKGKDSRHNSNVVVYSYIPTVSLHLIGSLPVGNENRSKFLRLDASLNQRFRFRQYSTFEYKIGGGAFLDKYKIWFPDFKHFGAYSLPSMRTFTNDGYFLIGYYKADTDDGWAKTTFNFMSEDFLLSRIKNFKKGDISEGLHFRYLWTSEINNYTEWGYSLGYKKYIRVGAFIGFEGVNYENFGISVSFPWLSGSF